MKIIHSIAGKIIYLVGYPVLKLFLINSRRAYIVVIYKNEILLTKNWLDFKRPWRLPGGGVHEGESSASAAARELAEEVGINIAENSLSLLAKNVPHRKGYFYDIFTVRLNQRPKMRLQYPEIWQAEFVDIKTINNNGITGEQLNFALTKLGL